MGVRRSFIAVALSFALLGATVARAQSGPLAERTGADNDRLFRAAAELYDLDPGLLAAIAAAESGGNPDAVSPKGAQGLMQLMPATANRFRVLDTFDPVSNTLGAVRFISYLRRYHTASGAGETLSLPEILAAYNAGEGAVDRFGGIPPYPETQRYVRKVLVAYLFGDSRSPLAARLSARAAEPVDSAPSVIRSKTGSGRAQPVLIHQKIPPLDLIDRLTEIQRLRQLELARQQALGRIGEPDGPR